METRLLKVTDVAELLAISRAKVYVLMADGSLPSVKIGGSRRIRAADVQEFVANLEPGLPAWD